MSVYLNNEIKKYSEDDKHIYIRSSEENIDNLVLRNETSMEEGAVIFAGSGSFSAFFPKSISIEAPVNAESAFFSIPGILGVGLDTSGSYNNLVIEFKDSFNVENIYAPKGTIFKLDNPNAEISGNVYFYEWSLLGMYAEDTETDISEMVEFTENCFGLVMFNKTAGWCGTVTEDANVNHTDFSNWDEGDYYDDCMSTEVQEIDSILIAE